MPSLSVDAQEISQLTELSDPPAKLYISGALPPLDRAIALVGTRGADQEGLDFARSLATELARAGCVVVSGGAFGIDRAAHEGALDAGAGTVAVLASGLDVAYPRSHAPLYARIARQGALVGERPDGTHPRPAYFLQRNRIIAALSRAVVVVQAPLKSGALSTAAHARALGRPVLAVPAHPRDPRGTGCLALLRQGASVCTGAADVLTVASLDSRKAPRASHLVSEIVSQSGLATDPLDPDARVVLERLGARAAHLDELIRHTGLPAGRVQRALLLLSLEGRITDLGAGRVKARR